MTFLKTLAPRAPALLLLLVLSAVVASAPEARATSPEPVRLAGPAGMSIVLLTTPATLPVIDVSLDLRAGSRHDPVGEEGTAALTAGLVGEALAAGANPKEQPAANESAHGRRAAALALQASASARADRASFRARMLSDAATVQASMDWMADSLARPSFDPDLVKRRIDDTLASLRDGLQEPGTLASRALYAAMYPDHPYGRLNTEASLKAITPAKLRRFYEAHWRPDNAVLVVVGPVSAGEAQAMAERLVAGWRPTGAANPSLNAESQPTKPPGRLQAIAHPSAQAHIWLGQQSLPMAAVEDQAVFTVANHILGGGGFVSRLTEAVREQRGLAYSVFSSNSPLQDAGPFFIGLQTERGKAAEALAVVRSELDRFLTEGPTQAELIAAKKNILGGYALRFDSQKKIVDQLSIVAFYGLPLNHFQAQSDRIAAVTVQDIRALWARTIRPELMQTVVVGGEGVQ